MGLKEAIRTMAGKATGKIPTWDMSDKGARERQVRHDYDFAKTERAEQTEKMVELNNYYNNQHYSGQQIAELAAKHSWNSAPPVIPYPFIHVEAQIDDTVPEFVFRGREGSDAQKAKEREDLVKYLFYRNQVKNLNLDNERTLNEIGNAFWKVAFDGSVRGPGFVGEIVIGNPDPANIFPDPSAYDVDDCEFIIYAYRMHRRKARRTFGNVIDSIYSDNDHGDTEIYESSKRSIDDDTLLVMEYWYRDDEGDIACSIQVNYTEVKHIPKYWATTRASGNKMYPIIKYSKIPVRKSFWDRGEIEAIQDLCDAADREFMTALLNDMMCANDIIVSEEGAIKNNDGKVPNMPGAHVIVKAGLPNPIRRLGGVSANAGLVDMITFIQDRIEQVTGNNDAAFGVEPTRVTTASGIAQLNERADRRSNIKKAGRLEGFARLAELCDWTALEFYNTDRIILTRGDQEQEDQQMVFNSDNYLMGGQPQVDPMTGMPMEAQEPAYYPCIDVEVTAGAGINKSKAFTLAATQELLGIQVTPINKAIVFSLIDLLDLPEKDAIKESIEQGLAALATPPGMGGAPGQGGGVDMEQVLSQLDPDEREALLNSPPEVQQKVMQEAMGGGAMGGNQGV